MDDPVSQFGWGRIGEIFGIRELRRKRRQK
jgi:hypothetical protein